MDYGQDGQACRQTFIYRITEGLPVTLEERPGVAKSPDVCPRLFRGRVARGLGYSYRKATMGSTRMARRAGR
jgi:hypothetical protein